ncbi:MAG: peptidylprolyl isomerase [Acidobacteriota bacterium]
MTTPSEHDAPAPSARSWALPILALLIGALGGWILRGVSRPAAAPVLPPPLVDDSDVLVEVGSQRLTLDQFRHRWERVLTFDERRRLKAAGGPELYLDQVTEQLTATEEALRLGLQDRPVTREAMRAAASRALVQPFLHEKVRLASVAESELRARFESRRDDWTSPLRVKVSEVVVTSRAEAPAIAKADDATTPESARAKAEKLLERARGGEDIAALARDHSEAPSSINGGNVGWIVDGRTLAEHEEAALKLEPGELTELLETPRGFAFLKITEREEALDPGFEAFQEILIDEVLAEDPGALERRFRSVMDELRSRHSPTVNRELLASFEHG